MTALAGYLSGTAVMRTGAYDTSGAGTSFYWFDPSSALSSNNIYSYCRSGNTNIISSFAGYTNYLTVNDFNAFIPSSSTINGITVSVERKNSLTGQADSLTVTTDAIFLMYDVAGTATTIGSKKSSATAWGTTDATETFGGAADLWGRSWTPSEINNANFGVAISAYLSYTYGGAESVGPNDKAQVDAITVTIDYTDTGGTRRRAIYTSQATLRTV